MGLERKMKKIPSVIILSLLLCAQELFARNIAGKFLISPHGSVGMSFAGGQLPHGDADPLPTPIPNESEHPVMGVGFAYNAGLSIGYAPVNSGAVMLGVEYASKPFVLLYNSGFGEYTKTFHTYFVDILLGWKGIYKYFYYEAGLFLGIKIQEWQYNYEFEDGTVERLYGGHYDIPEVSADNDFGIYLGLGASIPLANFVSIDIGVQLQAAWVPAYEEGDNDTAMSTLPLLFKVAFTFYI